LGFVVERLIYFALPVGNRQHATGRPLPKRQLLFSSNKWLWVRQNEEQTGDDPESNKNICYAISNWKGFFFYRFDQAISIRASLF
jgi:hypothetical protein